MTAIFQSFGLPELGVILLIALVLFGPSKLPSIGKSVGKALREFRESSGELTKAINEGVTGTPAQKYTAPLAAIANTPAPAPSTTVAAAEAPAATEAVTEAATETAKTETVEPETSN